MKPFFGKGAGTGAIIAIAILGSSCTSRHVPAPARVSPFVRGYIAVSVPRPGRPEPVGRGHDVFIPRVEVVLRDARDDTVGKPVTTDLSGRFTLPASPGRYRVCWKAEGASRPVAPTTSAWARRRSV
jgi:hypothetical protein